MQPLLYEVNNANAIEALAEAHLLYFHRVEATPVTLKLVALARQMRIPIIFDTDDLTWDPQIESYCFLRQHWPGQEVDDFLRAVKRHAQIMAQADYFVVSNPFLAQRVQADFNKKVYLHKNGISTTLQNLSEPFYRARLARGLPAATAPVTIAYFSGWIRAHQEDFEVALEPLRQILRDCPQARLKVVGYLNLDGLFPGYEDRLHFQDFVSWEKLPELVSQVDINLAPLVENPHRRCKSAVKFMEAALVGVPTVASNMEPYQEIQPGQTGFLASTPAEWYDCLLKLVTSPDLRLKMGAAARQQVLSQDTVQVRVAQFKEVIQQIIEDYYG
jgi:glycosyltransferase involved in cell wall biosynthesis